MAKQRFYLDKRDKAKLDRKFKKLKLFAGQGFPKEIRNIAANSVKIAQSRVPVDTGDLKKSIHVGGDLKTVYVAADMDYAGYVEYGTSRQNKQPYFFNSISDAVRIGTKVINARITKITRE